MNLPFSWLGAGISASPLAFQAIGQASRATSQLFGDLLSRNETHPINGHSERIANSHPTVTHSSRKASLNEVRQTLTKWIENASKQLRIPSQADEFTLEVDNGAVSIDGPEPVRSQLEQHLQGSSELVSNIVEAVEQSDSPLRWLPGTGDPRSIQANPFRMKLG